jgi:hypothetical protein
LVFTAALSQVNVIRKVFASVDDSATLDHTLHMLTWMFRGLMVFCAAVCVLLLFFFPLVHGPFQATHGPTTALRWRKALLALLFLLFYAAKGLLSRPEAVTDALIEQARPEGGAVLSTSLEENLAILRC